MGQLQEELPPAEPALSKKSAPLTAENLDKYQAEKSSQALSVASKKAGKKGKEKPAWAKTEKQQEEEKEAEIDELLEFAYELDYEKYMDDYEVRQALAIIKDRVNEVTKQQDWKEKIAEEWKGADEQEQEIQSRPKLADDPDLKSQVSYSK